MLPEPTKDHLKPFDGFFFVWGKDKYIIEVAQKSQEVLVPEDIHHEAHKTCRAVTQTLWQSIELVETYWRGESCKLLVLLMHGDVIEPRCQVHGTEYGIPP